MCFRNGLECLWRLRKLKKLILRDMEHVQDLKLLCLMLLDIFPDLVMLKFMLTLQPFYVHSCVTTFVTLKACFPLLSR